MKTTKEQRDNLRELLSKTSQGEWKIGKCVDGAYADQLCLVKADKGEVVGVRQIGRRQCNEVEDNAKFIVEVHNILMDLLDDLEEISQNKKATTGKNKNMEEKILEIINSHPSLDHKLYLTDEVKYMFKQIRTMREENQKSNERLNKIIDICLSK